MLVINPHLQIPLTEFEFSFTRSSGPGGQNVNKVSSKVQLRWQVLASPSLPPAVRERLLAKYGNRVTSEGELLLASQRFRDQGRNVDDCLEKLRAMLTDAATPPVRRKKTRPSRGSIERRLEHKREKARKKRGRQGRFSEE